MGQYYHPIILNKKNRPKAYFSPHEYSNGMKLMEHSYINNSLCNAVERYLIYNSSKVVWAGDYADEEPGTKRNLYDFCSYKMYTYLKVKSTDDNMKDLNGYFVVNHTKKLYYSRDNIPVSEVYDGYEIIINPLPILTCEGNGRGGGDYRGSYMSLVGSWARDEIELMKYPPDASYTEEVYDFKED